MKKYKKGSKEFVELDSGGSVIDLSRIIAIRPYTYYSLYTVSVRYRYEILLSDCDESIVRGYVKEDDRDDEMERLKDIWLDRPIPVKPVERDKTIYPDGTVITRGIKTIDKEESDEK